jgi:flagellar hook assembly protein FlgD
VVSVGPPQDRPRDETVLKFGPAIPNPSLGHVSFSLSLPKAALVELSIYDVRGRMINATISDQFSAGSHQIHWDGRTGGRALSGVYFARFLVDGELKAERRIVIVR